METFRGESELAANGLASQSDPQTMRCGK